MASGVVEEEIQICFNPLFVIFKFIDPHSTFIVVEMSEQTSSSKEPSYSINVVMFVISWDLPVKLFLSSYSSHIFCKLNCRHFAGFYSMAIRKCYVIKITYKVNIQEEVPYECYMQNFFLHMMLLVSQVIQLKKNRRT